MTIPNTQWNTPRYSNYSWLYDINWNSILDILWNNIYIEWMWDNNLIVKTSWNTR